MRETQRALPRFLRWSWESEAMQMHRTSSSELTHQRTNSSARGLWGEQNLSSEPDRDNPRASEGLADECGRLLEEHPSLAEVSTLDSQAVAEPLITSYIPSPLALSKRSRYNPSDTSNPDLPNLNPSMSRDNASVQPLRIPKSHIARITLTGHQPTQPGRVSWHKLRRRSTVRNTWG